MNNFKSKGISKAILIIFVAASVITASFVGIMRHKIEANYRNVELILDYAESVQATMMAGMPLEEYLLGMKEAGIYSVSVEEDTLSSMQSRGDVLLIPSSEVLKANFLYQTFSNLNDFSDTIGISVSGTFVVSLTQEAKDHLLEVLPIRMEKYADFKIADFEDQAIAFIPMTQLNTENLNVGFPENVMAELESYGFKIVARPTNSSGLTDSWINYIFETLDSRESIYNIVFKGQEVLGYPYSIGKVAKLIKSSEDLCVADIEFAAQLGSLEMARKVDNHLARMHSITREELNKGMDKQVALERYLRAVREREIRMIYLRPFSPLNVTTIDSLHEDVEFVRDLYTNLEEADFPVAHTQIIEKISVSTFSMSILVLGIVAAFMLALGLVFKVNSTFSIGLSLVACIGYFALLTVAPSLQTLGIKLVSLAAAIVFPTLAITYAVTFKSQETAGEERNFKLPYMLGEATKRFIVACVIGLAGGLVLAASMTYTSYILKVDQFNGVKLMHIVPILIGAVVYWISYMKKPDESLWQSFLRLANTPVLFWHVALVGVIGVVGLVLITRTGNSSSILPIGVSSLETNIRAFLERVLVIRPRSKELFVGHPGLVLLGGMIAAKEEKFWIFPVSLIAMIGLVSMVNTFAHMHTPLLVSLIRTLLGVGLGYLIGIVVLLIYYAIRKKVSKVG